MNAEAETGAFLDNLPEGAPDAAMLAALDMEHLGKRMRRDPHATMRAKVAEIVACAAAGHPGSQVAIGAVTAEFIAALQRRAAPAARLRCRETAAIALVAALSDAVAEQQAQR